MSHDYTALDAQIDTYLTHLRIERSLSDNTLEAYGRDLADFAGAMIEQRIEDAQSVRTEHVSDWVRGLAESGLEPSTQARMLVAVRGFYKHLVREKAVAEDPARLVDLPKPKKRLPETLSYEEVIRLLVAAAENHRDRAIVALLYGAGLRVSEVIHLEMSQLHLASAVIRVRGKGDKERAVPIGRQVIDLVQRYLELERSARLGGRSSELVFPGRSRSGVYTRQAVFAMLRKLGARASLERDVSPHRLRHAFATHLVQGGADLRAVQAMLGHADLRTTEVYTHVDDEHLRTTYDRTHPRS
jgi:integrase/recombinase XerD